MKKLSKVLLNKNFVLVVFIFAVAFFVRFYNFPDRVTFWSEQARSLMVSADYLNKPSLLGQEYFRQDSLNHVIFAGAFFNYSLVPLILISKFDPIKITSFFALFNLLTGLAVFVAAKKMFNEKVAVISLFLFLFNDFMVYHSLFIWSYNYLPFVGVLILYFSWRFRTTKDAIDIFLVGFFCGLGISLQYMFAFFAVAVFIANIWKGKHLLKDSLIFAMGIFLANLPLIIFDFRHNFYQTRTLLQYFVDTLKGKSGQGIAYYYFLPFWPVVAIAAAKLVDRLTKNNYAITALLTIYFVLNIASSKISLSSPTGMPSGITTKDIDNAAKRIAHDAEGGFNVSEVLDFDKKAYVLRYYLQYVYGKKPLDEASYSNINLLYVLSPKDYNFRNSNVWEVNAGGKYNTELLSGVGNGYAIYKLTK